MNNMYRSYFVFVVTTILVVSCVIIANQQLLCAAEVVRVIVELRDGSIVKGAAIDGIDAKPLHLKTEFGQLKIPRAQIRSLFVEQNVGGQKIQRSQKIDTTPPSSKKVPPKVVTKAPPPVKKNPKRIVDEEPIIPVDTPEDLAKMSDDDLIRLLESSSRGVPEIKEDKNRGDSERAPIDKLYSFDEDKDFLLPLGLTEVKGDLDAPLKGTEKAKSPELTEVDNQLEKIIEQKDSKEETNIKEPEKTDFSEDTKTETTNETMEVYIPKKGTIDNKIYRKIQKHGGKAVQTKDFRKLNQSDIDKLLEQHVPPEKEVQETPEP